MILYISGPMSHRRASNHPDFNRAQKRLEAEGFEVVNPAALDEAMDTTGWKHSDYLVRDVGELLKCRGVATLPGWQTSKGARIEVELAMGLDWPVMSVDDWIYSWEGHS